MRVEGDTVGCAEELVLNDSFQMRHVYERFPVVPWETKTRENRGE